MQRNKAYTICSNESEVPPGWFLHRFGEGKVVMIPVWDGLVLGRTMLKDSRRMSGKHARFALLPDDGVLLQDLDSTNGTFVNGLKVPAKGTVLEDCDCVSFGMPTPKTANCYGFVLRYKAAAAALPPPSSQVKAANGTGSGASTPDDDYIKEVEILAITEATSSPTDKIETCPEVIVISDGEDEEKGYDSDRTVVNDDAASKAPAIKLTSNKVEHCTLYSSPERRTPNVEHVEGTSDVGAGSGQKHGTRKRASFLSTSGFEKCVILSDDDEDAEVYKFRDQSKSELSPEIPNSRARAKTKSQSRECSKRELPPQVSRPNLGGKIKDLTRKRSKHELPPEVSRNILGGKTVDQTRERSKRKQPPETCRAYFSGKSRDKLCESAERELTPKVTGADLCGKTVRPSCERSKCKQLPEVTGQNVGGKKADRTDCAKRESPFRLEDYRWRPYTPPPAYYTGTIKNAVRTSSPTLPSMKQLKRNNVLAGVPGKRAIGLPRGTKSIKPREISVRSPARDLVADLRFNVRLKGPLSSADCQPSLTFSGRLEHCAFKRGENGFAKTRTPKMFECSQTGTPMAREKASAKPRGFRVQAAGAEYGRRRSLH